MNTTVATLRRLVEIGVPNKLLVPVMEVFENPNAAGEPRKKRKRRTKAEMAADAAKEARAATRASKKKKAA